ncbi:hypothetical protein A8B82_13255 [Sulfitobacter sp. EhC04]|uniref:hypothetical protein n=1 Tax=Sulfitobacter sp. EhC04 TaxID=1849168 RepID=UPI0007F3E333|nr:hypothetical protein [Sulfitobacter sp. EhC04]OAN77165.1 hypothetical protein A8B82_13255 [Sulfitobacter sp. EhC04]
MPEIKDSLKTALLRSADVPADRLEGSCLEGDKMTHADILGAWAAMMRDRPAFKAAQEKVAESRRLSIFHRVALQKSGSMAIGGGLGWQGLRINA